MTDDTERDDRRPVFGERDSEKQRAPFGSYKGQRQPELDLQERDLPDLVPLPEVDADEAPEEEDEVDPSEVPPVEPRSAIDEVAEAIIPEEKDFAPPPEPEPEPEPEPVVPQRRRLVVLKPGLMARTGGMMLLAAALVATMFTWWTPNAFLSANSLEQLSVAQATRTAERIGSEEVVALGAQDTTPTPTFAPPPPPELNRVGIVAGHTGYNPQMDLPDPGAVCEDENGQATLTEVEINVAVAQKVAELLEGHGYEVDILEEFDERLTGYRARAMVSIHADSCENYGEGASGYKVASFSYSANPTEDDKLVTCLSDRYQETTGLPFHPSITYDMTEYHNFREIDPSTPGAIIEIGFMYLDREILTQDQDVVALGVARGVLCYLRGEMEELAP